MYLAQVILAVFKFRITPLNNVNLYTLQNMLIGNGIIPLNDKKCVARYH